jgi:hypothetical protein
VLGIVAPRLIGGRQRSYPQLGNFLAHEISLAVRRDDAALSAQVLPF